MEFRTAAIVSCWFSVAIIASVYMFVFAGSLGDILFGVFLPVGALVFVALIVTIILSSNKQEKT
jgi:Mg/Co/Ni transporter MgtE